MRARRLPARWSCSTALVQPRRRRTCHGLLHGGGIPGVLRSAPRFERMIQQSGAHPPEVLAIDLRRGAGASLQGAHQRPDEAVEAEPDGPRGAGALGGLRRGQGRDVRPYRHEGSTWYVVEADSKREARLNLISHLLDQIPSRTSGRRRYGCRHRERAYVRPPEEADLRAATLCDRVSGRRRTAASPSAGPRAAGRAFRRRAPAPRSRAASRIRCRSR